MHYKIQEIEEMLNGQASSRMRWLYEDFLEQAERIRKLEIKNEDLLSRLFFAEHSLYENQK